MNDLLERECQTCRGIGHFPARIGDGFVYIPARDCFECNGTGIVSRFQDNDLFCKKCLTHESNWTGGGSWSPDECPCTEPNEGTDVIAWRDMDKATRIKAATKFEEMWNQKFPRKK